MRTFLEAALGYPAGATLRWQLPSIVFLTVALVAWLFLQVRVVRTQKARFIWIEAAVGPAAWAWALFTWIYCFFSSVLPGDEVRRSAPLWWLLEGKFWRAPIQAGLEAVGLFGADSPWNRGIGSSPWPADFPNDDTFYFVVLGQLNEAMMLGLVLTAAVVALHAGVERRRRRRASHPR
jgi:hypothetical protein